MSSARARARGIPKKIGEFSIHRLPPHLRAPPPQGASIHPQGVSRACGSGGRDQVAERDRAGADDVGVHGDAQLAAAAERLEPRRRRGHAVLGEVDRAAPFDAFDHGKVSAADLDQAVDPALLLERLGRLDDQVGAQPAAVGVDAQLARAPRESGGADDRDRAGVEVRDVALGPGRAPDRRTARSARRRAAGHPPASGRRPGRPARCRRAVSRRRTRRPRRVGGSVGSPCRLRTARRRRPRRTAGRRPGRGRRARPG